MEEAYERVGDAQMYAQQRRIYMVQDTEFVLSIMRYVEAELNAGIVSNALQNSTEDMTTTLTNRIEEENVLQHLVSSVTVRNLTRASFYQSIQVGPRELENLAENIDVRELGNRWPGEIVRRQRIILGNENVNDDYVTTFRLAENLIIIRYILDFRNPDNGVVQFSTQLIWNSRFSRRQIMQHLEENTYNFNFEHELISIAMIYSREESVDIISPAEVVDRLPDVIIGHNDSAKGDDLMCPICHDDFASGESAKQLRCNHVYHSHCILQWFTHKISCPTCRSEPLAPQSSP